MTLTTTPTDVRATVLELANAGRYAEAARTWQDHLNATWTAFAEAPGQWTPDWSKRCQAAEKAAQKFFRDVANEGASVAVGALVAGWSA